MFYGVHFSHLGPTSAGVAPFSQRFRKRLDETVKTVPSARARPQVFLVPEKAASVKRPDAVLGNVNLPSWCFTVVRHGGHAHRGVYCLLPPQKIRR